VVQPTTKSPHDLDVEVTTELGAALGQPMAATGHSITACPACPACTAAVQQAAQAPRQICLASCSQGEAIAVPRACNAGPDRHSELRPAALACLRPNTRFPCFCVT